MFRGSGISQADQLVKADGSNSYLVSEDTPALASFEGFECRWNEIPSPNEELVTLLVNSLDRDSQTANLIYADIFETIRKIYGEDSDLHPVRKSDLSLTFSLKKLSAEARIRSFPSGRSSRVFYQIKLIWLAIVGKFLMRLGIKIGSADWGKYKEHFVLNTDFRKFDDTLRMVISGSSEQRNQLENYLTELRNQKHIAYGLHVSHSCIVTCMVSDYNRNHMHFVDGAAGGYASAAKALKAQLATEHNTK